VIDTRHRPGAEVPGSHSDNVGGIYPHQPDRTVSILAKWRSAQTALDQAITTFAIAAISADDQQQVAQGLIGVVQAARLLGTEVLLVGIRPEVAQIMVGLGLDLRAEPSSNGADRKSCQ
jgi:hypothetical protein